MYLITLQVEKLFIQSPSRRKKKALIIVLSLTSWWPTGQGRRETFRK